MPCAPGPLALVGDGPHRQNSLEKGVAGSAPTFLGYMAGEELASAICSAMLSCSLQPPKNPGAVLLGGQNWAAGCPVCGATAGGIPDIVTMGQPPYVSMTRTAAHGSWRLATAPPAGQPAASSRGNCGWPPASEAERWGLGGRHRASCAASARQVSMAEADSCVG